MLDITYGLDVPSAMVEFVEHLARLAGLPLSVLERVGRNLATVEGFIVAAEDGRAWEFVARLDATA